MLSSAVNCDITFTLPVFLFNYCLDSLLESRNYRNYYRNYYNIDITVEFFIEIFTEITVFYGGVILFNLNCIVDVQYYINFRCST